VGGLLRRSPQQMQSLRSSFLARAELSVFLGRFIAVLRVLAGPMAGAVAMPYRRFLICNLAGAVLWAVSMVSLAWLCGRWIPIERLLSGVMQLGLVALMLVLLLVVLPRVIERLERLEQR
jgi:membrane protein DedA with SNARE-associated domain